MARLHAIALLGLLVAAPAQAADDPALAHALADLADLVLTVDQGVACLPSRSRQQVN